MVFDSDLNRKTLPGSHCERHHATRANRRLDSPQMHMPDTLCQEFVLLGEHNGTVTELLHVTDNRKRAWHVKTKAVFEKLTLIPVSSWGETEEIPVISFDFQ